jgi:epoxyqueuosine reductase
MKANRLQFSIVPVTRVRDLQAEIEEVLHNNIDSPDFAEYAASAYTFHVVDRFSDAQSVIVAAGANPAHKVLFHWQGREVEGILPPGYINFRGKQQKLFKTVFDILEPLGYRAERVILPVKLLAAHTGLGRYGRNNLCYIEGMGSYHYLGTFLTDLPAPSDPWQPCETALMCSGCRECQKACPSGAIDTDRFLLHAERCLTLYNRNLWGFPNWIKPKWHHTWAGCIRCQETCPMNREYARDVVLFETFSEEETGILLEWDGESPLPPELMGRMERFGFPELYGVLSRNLKALIEATAP